MKTTLLTIAAGLMAFALSASGQNPPAPSGQAQQPAQGAGRGGAPHAWGDKNKDGICDVTGKPVGQGRAQAGAGRMGRRGRSPMRGGMRNCCMQNQPAAAAPAAKK